MPALARRHQLKNTLIYHVINRGNRREDIFHYPEDYQYFMLGGHIWQGRFKSQPIEKENYLLACGRYVERNPVKAKIVTLAEDYEYSSDRFYVYGKDDGVTKKDPLIESFGIDIIERRKKYADFLKVSDEQEEELFKGYEQPIGSVQFKSRLIYSKGRYVPRRKGGQDRRGDDAYAGVSGGCAATNENIEGWIRREAKSKIGGEIMVKMAHLPKQLRRETNIKRLESICKENDVVFMALFGSFAKGEETKESDIDLIISFDKSKEKSLLDLIHTENEIKKIFKRKVDALTPESVSPYLRNDILRSAKVIYERR